MMTQKREYNIDTVWVDPLIIYFHKMHVKRVFGSCVCAILATLYQVALFQ